MIGCIRTQKEKKRERLIRIIFQGQTPWDIKLEEETKKTESLETVSLFGAVFSSPSPSPKSPLLRLQKSTLISVRGI